MTRTSEKSVFPLTGPIPTVGADKAKVALVLLDNLNANMEWRLVGRAFNDPMARTSWVDLGSGWNTTTAGDATANTGELDLVTPLSPSTNQWFELALAVRKAADANPASRCVFHVIPAIKYN